jgi:hypothetical protein
VTTYVYPGTGGLALTETAGSTVTAYEYTSSGLLPAPGPVVTYTYDPAVPVDRGPEETFCYQLCPRCGEWRRTGPAGP